MGNIKANIVISTDGYIAHKDDDLSWIPNELMQRIFKEYESADVLLAGFNTYNYFYERHASWVFKNKSYIVSNYENALIPKESLFLLHGNTIDAIEKIKADNDNIMIVGGGKLITSLLNNQLIDEIELYIVPVLLGEGIQFLGRTFDVRMELITCKQENNVAHLSYKVLGKK